MNSFKSPLILVLILIIITVVIDAKEAKISNYVPTNAGTQLNNQRRIVSYTVPNSQSANYSDNSGDERQEFLKAHNGARIRSGLTPLAWDTKLENSAGKYASNRRDDCDLDHLYGKYGENVFWGSGNDWTPTEIVKLWVKEHRFYIRRTKECTSGKICGHYTQVMWRNTRYLGCAKIDCATGDTFAICIYDPPGNVVGQGPFDSKH